MFERPIADIEALLVAIALVVAVTGVSAAGQQPSAAPSPSLSQLQQAANRGDARAQFNLGTYYSRADVPERNDALALEWLQKSAEQGLADAQHSLAMMYLDARGYEAGFFASGGVVEEGGRSRFSDRPVLAWLPL